MTEEAIRIDTCSECGEEEETCSKHPLHRMCRIRTWKYAKNALRNSTKVDLPVHPGTDWKRIFGELSVLVLNYYQTHMTYSKRSSLQVDPATRLARLRRRVRESSVR